MAKRRFTEWKLRLRSQLAITHSGPGTLEDTVQDYINRHIDFYELENLVSVKEIFHQNDHFTLENCSRKSRIIYIVIVD